MSSIRGRRLFALCLIVAIWWGVSHAPPLQAGPGTTVPILVQGHVDLQRPNAPPPDPSWVVPITLTLSIPQTSDIRYTWYTQTDESGNFSLVETFEPGRYDVRVKNVHTLRNLKQDVLFIVGTNTLNLGTLREGDATNDNRVNVADFTLLRNAYFAEEGQPGFDPRTDFDEDHRINVRDFALLRGNYFSEGDVVVPRQPADTATTPVVIFVQPQRVRTSVGALAALSVQVQAGSPGVVGTDIVMNFDPTQLRIVAPDGTPTNAVTPGDAFDTVLTNQVDNTTGRIAFGAGTFGTPVTGQHTLFSFSIQAVRETGVRGAPILFSYADAVNGEGRSLPTRVYPSYVQVGTFTYVYIPAVVQRTTAGDP